MGQYCSLCGQASFSGCSVCEGANYLRKEVHDFASYFGSSSPCDDCVFPIRKPNGIAVPICYACVKKEFSDKALRQCPVCLIFDEFEGQECDWCKRHGLLVSVYKSVDIGTYGQPMEPPDLTEEELRVVKRFHMDDQSRFQRVLTSHDLDASQETMDGLVEKSVIHIQQSGPERSYYIRDWMQEWREWMRERSEDLGREREIRITCHYDDILKALINEEMIDFVYRLSLSGNDQEAADRICGVLNERVGVPLPNEVDLVRYLVEHRMEDLRRFHVFQERHGEGKGEGEGEGDDIFLQMKRLLSLDPIPPKAIYLEVSKYKEEGRFDDYLNADSVLPAEFRILVMEKTLFEFYDPMKGSGHLDGLREGFHRRCISDHPYAFNTLVAIGYSYDHRHNTEFSLPRASSWYNEDEGLLRGLLSQMSGETLAREPLSLEGSGSGHNRERRMVILDALSNRGDSFARYLSEYLINGTLEPKLPAFMRLVQLVNDIGSNEFVTSRLSDALKNVTDLDLICHYDQYYDFEVLLRTLLDAREYHRFTTVYIEALPRNIDRHLRFFSTDKFKEHMSRIGPVNLESIFNTILEERTSRTHRSPSLEAGKEDLYMVSGHIVNMILQLVLNRMRDAHGTYNEILTAIDVLKDKCAKAGAPNRSLDRMRAILDNEGLALLGHINRLIPVVQQISVMKGVKRPEEVGPNLGQVLGKRDEHLILFIPKGLVDCPDVLEQIQTLIRDEKKEK